GRPGFPHLPRPAGGHRRRAHCGGSRRPRPRREAALALHRSGTLRPAGQCHARRPSAHRPAGSRPARDPRPREEHPMTDPAPTPRVYLAIRPSERELLYDEPTLARLRELAEVVLAPDPGAGRAELPAGLADDFDVLITSWSTAPFTPEQLVGTRLRLAVHTAGTVRGLFPKEVLTRGVRLAQGGS